MMTDRDDLRAALRKLNNAAWDALRASMRDTQNPNPDREAILNEIAEATDKMVGRND